MKKIVLIIPYFGKLPEYARFFFISARYNQDIDFLLFSDQNVCNLPDNVHLHKMTFEELKELVQSKFDFPICLEQPYKLCDYKPAYGYIFEEYLSGYEFWGHCDLDMVLGDVMSFLSPEIFDNYDKIYQHGHLCMYKNTPRVNHLFMEKGGMDYREVFSTSIIRVFDEIPGIQRIFDSCGIQTYKKWDFLDIEPWKYHMQRAVLDVPDKVMKDSFDYYDECFFYENGRVFRAYFYENEVHYQEFNYLHFQKRKYAVPQFDGTALSSFFMTNTGIIPKQEGFWIQKEEIRKYNSRSWFQELLYYYRMIRFIWKRRINKYIFHKG